MNVTQWAAIVGYPIGWAVCTVVAARALNAVDARVELERRRRRHEEGVEPLVEPGERAFNIFTGAGLALFRPFLLPFYLLYRLVMWMSGGRLFASAPERDWLARAQATAAQAELERVKALAEQHGLKFPTPEDDHRAYCPVCQCVHSKLNRHKP